MRECITWRTPSRWTWRPAHHALYSRPKDAVGMPGAMEIATQISGGQESLVVRWDQ